MGILVQPLVLGMNSSGRLTNGFPDLLHEARPLYYY